VVGGLQQVRPRMLVRSERVAMPSLAPQPPGAETPPEPRKSAPAREAVKSAAAVPESKQRGAGSRP
jgi:hypothetical protein